MSSRALIRPGAWLLVVAVASCAGPTREEATVRETTPGGAVPGESPPDAGTSDAEPRPPEAGVVAEPPARACDQEGPEKAACDCAAGDDEACLEHGDHLFARGKNALAMSVVERVCASGNAEGCLRAATFIERQKMPARAGVSADELRERAANLLEQQCGQDRAEACFRLGELLYRGRHLTRDVQRGLANADRACVLGGARACAFLAGIYEQGAGVDKDEERALGYLELACTEGRAAECSHFGDKIAKRDRKRALALYEKACAAEDGAGCARLGDAYEGGRAVRRDYVRALEHFEKACDLEHTPSCARAADRLASGKGVTQDLERARARYALACADDQGEACFALAALVANGRGGPRNWGEAVSLYEKACQMKVRKACKQGARLARRPPDWRCSDAESCRAKCGERIARSCTALGRLVATTPGDHRCSRAMEAFELGCERGDGAACVPLGNAERSPDRALIWYQKGCAGSDKEACALYHFSRYQLGDDSEQKASVEALRKACKRNNGGDACVSLAGLYARGERKPKLARKLWRAACARKHGRACSILALDYAFGAGATSADGVETDDEALQKYRELVGKACDFGYAAACRDLSASYSYENEATSRMWAERARALEPIQPCRGLEAQ